MKICVIADLHGLLPEIPACDLLLIAGDVTPVVDHRIERQREWLGGPFWEWLVRNPVRQTVAIAGNHDFIAEVDPEFMRTLPWTYLADESAEILGFKIHGSPWANKFGDWAFMRDEIHLGSRWQAIPEDTQILLTHGPPYGYGDLVSRGEKVGSASLRQRLDLLGELRLHVFGHIHEDPGSWKLNGITLINATWVDLMYRPRPFAQPPVFEKKEVGL